MGQQNKGDIFGTFLKTVQERSELSYRTQIFKDIVEERARQDKLHPDFPDWDLARLPILIEEVGEIAKDIHEVNHPHMRQEIVEAAAVCVRWLEAYDEEIGSHQSDHVPYA